MMSCGQPPGFIVVITVDENGTKNLHAAQTPRFRKIREHMLQQRDGARQIERGLGRPFFHRSHPLSTDDVIARVNIK